MGRSYTPPYRLEMSNTTSACWLVNDRYQIKGSGKPTYANLVKFILEYARKAKQLIKAAAISAIRWARLHNCTN